MIIRKKKTHRGASEASTEAREKIPAVGQELAQN
jgi:hypothetical protein